MGLASLFKSGILFSSIVLLVACGGGSSGSGKSSSSVRTSSSAASSSSLASLKPQTLVFEREGTTYVTAGDSFVNKAMGQGSGQVSYMTSDPGLVDVDADGKVTVEDTMFLLGHTWIRASIEADDEYAEAIRTHVVKVLPKTLAFSAWIGKDDTLVGFPAQVDGFAFYRANTESCTGDAIIECSNAQSDVLEYTNTSDSCTGSSCFIVPSKNMDDVSITDTQIKLDQQGNYAVKQGGFQGSFPVDHLSDDSLGHPAFYPQSRHDVVVHNDQLWLFGVGETGDSLEDPSHSVWRSRDGAHWEQTLMYAPSNKIFRSSFNVVSFKNTLWMVAGDFLDSTMTNNVFVEGGQFAFSWIDRTDENAFSKRITQPIVFKDKLWVIGGNESATTFKNDIWSSADGLEWTQESADAGFSARSEHQVVIFNDKLWLIGGSGSNIRGEKDVWSSVDGVNWVEETNNAAFGFRHGHQVVSFNNKLWLIGGISSVPNDNGTFVMNRVNDVWSSVDGINWVRELAAAPFSARSNHQMVVFNEKLFLVGGFGDDVKSKNDVWSSADGINWRKGFAGEFTIDDQPIETE